jgi:hypothetical protein
VTCDWSSVTSIVVATGCYSSYVSFDHRDVAISSHSLFMNRRAQPSDHHRRVYLLKKHLLVSVASVSECECSLAIHSCNLQTHSRYVYRIDDKTIRVIPGTAVTINMFYFVDLCCTLYVVLCMLYFVHAAVSISVVVCLLGGPQESLVQYKINQEELTPG